MQNLNNVDFYINENAQESTNSLSKSVDMLSTRELILSLNDSFISRKSKEYNFDFANAASYDANETLSLASKHTCFSQIMQEKPIKFRLIARKTASNLIKENEAKNNFNDKKTEEEKEEEEREEKLSCFNNFNKSKNIQLNNNDYPSKSNKQQQNNYFININNNNNPNNEFKSKQNFGNFTRNSSSEAIKKLKERLISMQQKKKIEFSEAKNQKQESSKEMELDDNPNVFYE